MSEFPISESLWLWFPSFALSFCIAWIVVWIMLHPRAHWERVDVPNERSSHQRVTPRGGGLAIVLGAGFVGLGFVLFGGKSGEFFWPAVATTLIVAVSYADDVYRLGVLLKLTAHVIAALIVLSFFVIEQLRLPGLDIPLSATLAALLTGLFIVWMVNLYNFMDGMDGLCATMTSIGFLALAVLGYLKGHTSLSIACVIVAGAASGFLSFNLPPARIFMGDVGSATLGFLVAVVAIWCERHDVAPLWQSLLIFSPFLVDASVTLLLRAWQRKPIWQAHREHYYQRMMALGWSHRRVLAIESAVMAGCAGSALLCSQAGPAMHWGVLGFWALFYVAAIFAIHAAQRGRVSAT